MMCTNNKETHLWIRKVGDKFNDVIQFSFVESQCVSTKVHKESRG